MFLTDANIDPTPAVPASLQKFLRERFFPFFIMLQAPFQAIAQYVLSHQVSGSKTDCHVWNRI